MDLHTFLDHVHSGAFYVFENIITCLPKRDLKALRLCVNKSLSASIYPYMFQNLYFSVHSEDHDVFQRTANDTITRRYVNQILWDVSIPTTHLHVYREGFNRQNYYVNHLAANRTQGRIPETINRSPVRKELRLNRSMYLQASEHWVTRERAWAHLTQSGEDLAMFKHCLCKFSNLRRITILVEQPGPCVPFDDFNHVWSTPRSRNWAKLPFFSVLLRARPQILGDGSRGYARTISCLESLCRSSTIKIGSIIVESFGLKQLHRSRGTDHRDATSTTLDRHQHPYRDFDDVVHGFGALVPDCSDPSVLTLRMLIEITPDQDSLWGYRVRSRRPVDSLAHTCSHTLSEMTYSRIDLHALINHYTPDPSSSSSDTDTFCHLTGCRNLVRLRLHECWCLDAAWVLKWIHEHTSVRYVELWSVTSKGTSWYNVLNELKRDGVVFQGLELRSCRSPAEIFGVQFEPGVLAPWNGESEKVVKWLQSKNDGAGREFPLWQGPG